MSNTYTQLYIQCVWHVRSPYRLEKEWREELFRYISGIITAKGHKSIQVNGTHDHVHILFGLNPASSVSDLVRDVKNNSSKFLKTKKYVARAFSWQSGYGAFSYRRSDLEQLYDYILNQELHHRTMSFREEYISMLERYGICFDPRYLMDD